MLEICHAVLHRNNDNDNDIDLDSVNFSNKLMLITNFSSLSSRRRPRQEKREEEEAQNPHRPRNFGQNQGCSSCHSLLGCHSRIHIQDCRDLEDCFYRQGHSYHQSLAGKEA